MDSTAEFDALFRHEFPAVWRAVYLICQDRDRAQEITQDAFVQLFTHWKKVSRYERPGAWVRRVAIRLGVRAVRRERMRADAERALQLVPATESGVDVDVIRAVRQLSGMQRAAVVLFYLEDRSVDEVAGILDCSNATVRVHLHRARRRLAGLLGEDVLDVT